MSFSVLLSVYYREKPDYFFKSLESILNQSLPPSEIVIVKDGPLTPELDEVINHYNGRACLNLVSLEKNYGLGIALNHGLSACTYDIVARMDSDDIARHDRFERQISFITKHSEYDLVGSNIAEFNRDIDDIVSYRKVPEHPDEIASFARRRSPVNHMSVVFRKDAVLKAGGYLPFRNYEDYHLWMRMLIHGSKFYNIQENLIFARIGNDMLARRQGLMYFKQELKLQSTFLKAGFIKFHIFILNIMLRAIPRLMPLFMLKIVYNRIRK
jgi:glycosyltransferase involved in cell wall biosynthesis